VSAATAAAAAVAAEAAAGCALRETPALLTLPGSFGCRGCFLTFCSFFFRSCLCSLIWSFARYSKNMYSDGIPIGYTTMHTAAHATPNRCRADPHWML